MWFRTKIIGIFFFLFLVATVKCVCACTNITEDGKRKRERGREGESERAREGGERAYPFIPQSFSRASSAIDTDAAQYTEGTVLPN